jgi:acyl-CoA thioester hydrolase
MGISHIRAFRVRNYECDPYGMLSPAAYLRYMQEAAFDASAVAGYDMARYRRMGRTWLIRETDIHYLRPLHYNAVVEVRTWIADFQRVRSRRAYEFRQAGSGDLVAQAATDWAFLDTAKGHPTAIPLELMTAFFPEGAPRTTEPRRHLPRQSPPIDAFRMQRRIEWSDLDPGKHVNNARFLALVEECTLQATEAVGWSPERLRTSGVRWTPRRHMIEYLQPGLFGQELEFASWLSELTAESAIRSCVVSQDGGSSVLVRARSEWICRELQSEQPVPMPESLRRDIRSGSRCHD